MLRVAAGVQYQQKYIAIDADKSGSAWMRIPDDHSGLGYASMAYRRVPVGMASGDAPAVGYVVVTAQLVKIVAGLYHRQSVLAKPRIHDTAPFPGVVVRHGFDVDMQDACQTCREAVAMHAFGKIAVQRLRYFDHF